MVGTVGWRCRACFHYYQLPPDTPPPRRCRHCGAWGPMRRIDHDHVPPAVSIGDTVRCEIVGEVRQTVVGEVVDVGPDRVSVDSRDGTGIYTVTPEQIVHRRSRRSRPGSERYGPRRR